MTAALTWRGCYDHGWQKGDLVPDEATLQQRQRDRARSAALVNGLVARGAKTDEVAQHVGFVSRGELLVGDDVVNMDIAMNKEAVYGLYDLGWRDLITPESYSHPAKFSRGLIYWIIKTGIERAWWVKGETTLLDPFGGVGLGGIAAAAHGLEWVGVELEPRFVALARENWELHRKEWEAFGLPMPTMIQGDSRRLCELVGPVMGVVASPPYVSGGHHADQTGAWNVHGGDGTYQGKDYGAPMPDLAGYGTTPGQIGRMRAVVASPPFTEAGSSAAHDDYWTACRQVYEQCWQLLPEGGRIVLVVKSYVKNKQIVDQPGMTLALLADIGFTPEVWINAMLTAEDGQMGFDGATTHKKRASFFRRLYERRFPENSIDAEVVLVAQKKELP